MSLIIMSREEFYTEVKKRFGENPKDWTFECPWCKFRQSMNSILTNIKRNGLHLSQRYGEITKENISQLQPKVDQECLSAQCNYAAYGLISGSLEVDGHRYLNLAVIQNSTTVTDEGKS